MTIEDFKLDSVKILNEDVVIEYHTTTDSAKQTYNEKKRKPHPDFSNSVQKFLPYYNQLFGLEDEDTVIKGISIKSEKIQIIGMIPALTGNLCSLNTPFFNIEEELTVSNETINKLLENVRTESWKYIYERKSSQQELELFTETEKEENE